MSETAVAPVDPAEQSLIGGNTSGDTGPVRCGYTSIVSRKTQNEDIKNDAKAAGCPVGTTEAVFRTAISGVNFFDKRLVFTVLSPVTSVYCQVTGDGAPVEGTGITPEDFECLTDAEKRDYRKREFAVLLVYPQAEDAIIKATVSVFETGSRELGSAGLLKNPVDWVRKLPADGKYPYGIRALGVRAVGTVRLEKIEYKDGTGKTVKQDAYRGSSTVVFVQGDENISNAEKIIGGRGLLLAQYDAALKSIQYKVRRLVDGPKDITANEAEE